MMRKLQFVFIISLFLGAFSLQAQKELKIADKQFDLNVYDLAIESYKSALKLSPLNYHANSRIAEAHYMMNNLVDAITWYEKVITMKDVKAEDILNYAHSLKKLGKYESAKNKYEAYSEYNPDLGIHYAESCDYVADIIAQGENFHLTKFEGNSPKSDFGPSFYNGHLVFSSFNDQIKRRVYKRNKSYIQSTGNQLFAVDNSGKNYIFLRPEIKEIYNIGPISYDESGKSMAYTKNNFADGRVAVDGDDTGLSIYTATVLNNGDFINDRAFPFNSSLYANGFPYMTDEGQTMYFASNMIGGFGGYDLYITHFIDGKWTIPENLGSQINSKGNEICPYISDNNLYFSSDYHFGLGGFDVFYCENSYGDWTFPQNMGTGINSSADDYFFSVNPINGKMYFTSNREGGTGKDDIYMASPKLRPQFAAKRQLIEHKNSMPSVGRLTANVEAKTDIVFPAMNSNEAMASLDSKEMDFAPMPPAMHLKELEKRAGEKPEMSVVSTVAERWVKNASSDNSFDMTTARKVSHGDVLKAEANVFFIQLASLSRSSGNFSKFKDFVQYGNLYKVHKTNSVKIRLGYYTTRDEAMEVLQKIRKNGIKDAFLVFEPLITSQLELIASTYTNDIYQEDNTFVPTNKSSNYKIRLASYTDPLWFDTEAVGDLGEIEQWTKGDWTIFVLSGYKDLEEAKQAHVKALNRGFTEAHVVVDNEGILEKLKEN